MNLVDLRRQAEDAASDGAERMPLVTPKGFKPPPKFPRGELLCENVDGSNVRGYPTARVLKWLDWADKIVAEKGNAE